MSALNFDPHAVLAEIQNRKPNPATPATLATERPPTREGIATVAIVARAPVEIPESEKTRSPTTRPANGDPEIYLSHLRENGPKPYGSVATALGWGATRAWQAEARLRKAERLVLDERGAGQSR